MRIVSGRLKGRRIIAPKHLPVRPTTDMAKEALFNILNNKYFIEDLKVLDLFAGIGSISFEFASRGCDDITAVDGHHACVRFLESTNHELDTNLTTIKSDAFKFLERNNQKFDLIFADPPYDLEQNKFQKLVDLVFDRDLLNENGSLIIEHSKNTDLSKDKRLTQQRKYGSNIFSFFEKQE
ncbi:RsmD family RNA methyltransferase [Lutimonas saemankumensis]|uniref:RsmD family RNA methyltransferase n=1 Tax=Lutimonas saemankumensis TaxID=483016 RepID=UPI001CD411DA|nr:RsmD family RNA methyltransferase [Lutimonas saemankumensis]MCA0931495.1 RsmD family RNA methyltransferase [Lutimonas saemankumensis]